MVFHPDRSFNLPLLPPDLKEKDLFNPKITQLVIKAHRSIGELKGACHALNNPVLFPPDKGSQGG